MKKSSNQLDLFAENQPQFQLINLVVTPLPNLEEMLERIGTCAQWQQTTLSELLSLWYELNEEYINVLDSPLAQAKKYVKPTDKTVLAADDRTQHHYRKEYSKLSEAKKELTGQLYNTYCERMTELIEQARLQLKNAGVNDEETELVAEFINEIFQHPDPGDLSKTMNQLIPDLSREYLSLNSL